MKRFMAVVCVLGLATTASPSSAQDTDVRTQLFDDVLSFSERVWAGPGLQVTRRDHSPQTTVLDFTSGYGSVDGVVFNWNGSMYESVSERPEAAALPLMGAPDAEWVKRSSDAEGILTPLSMLALTDGRGFPSRFRSLVRTQTPGLVTYRSPADRWRLSIAGDALTVASPGTKATWRIGAFPVTAPVGEMVDEADLMEAAASRQYLRMVNEDVVASARSAQSEADVRASVRQSTSYLPVRVTPVPRGVRIALRTRYVHRVWLVRFLAHEGGVAVTRRNLHPRGWSPPRQVVTAPAATLPTASGVKAVRLLEAARIWTLEQPGVELRANQRGSSETTMSTSLDHTNGVAAIMDATGAITGMSDARQVECYSLVPMSKIVRRVLRLTGELTARWACGPGGDTDLAWAPAWSPLGMGWNHFTMMFSPDVVLTSTATGAVVSSESDTYSFSGEALTDISHTDGQEVVELHYEYGLQNLRMPAAYRRVNSGLLDAAIRSVRARAQVRRSTASMRGCLQHRIARGLAPAVALRRCERSEAMKDGYVFTRSIPNGFRLYERNRFGVDSRDVLIRGERVVVRNVVHQRYVR